MRRVLVVLACVVAATALAAAPAAAHDELVGTTPADGTTVATAPDQVVLTFAEPAVALGTQVVVTGPDGASLSQGDAQLVGSTVVQALAAARPAGSYTVDWRVTSDDGHPVTGSFTFTATAATGPATPTPTAPTSTPTSSPAPAAAPSPSATSALVTEPTATLEPLHRNLAPLVILVLVVVALVVTRIGRMRSLRRIAAEHATPPGTAGDPASSGSADGPPGGV